MTSNQRPTVAGIAGSLWGVLGVLYVLGRATVRLSLIAYAATSQMGALEWAPCLAWVGFNAYAEGYRGFQKAFAPRVVARTWVLLREPSPLRVLLAPLFVVGFVDATRKRMLVSWLVAGGIAGLVIAVRSLAQPWRGIVDAGVVVGLGWGIVSLVALLVRAAAGDPPDVDPELSAHSVARGAG